MITSKVRFIHIMTGHGPVEIEFVSQNVETCNRTVRRYKVDKISGHSLLRLDRITRRATKTSLTIFDSWLMTCSSFYGRIE